MQYEIYKGTSRKGTPYEALKIKIGEYQTIIFPTKIEMLYIKTILRKSAQDDFKQGSDSEEELNVDND